MVWDIAGMKKSQFYTILVVPFAGIYVLEAFKSSKSIALVTKTPCVMCVRDAQYIRGCSVHRGGTMSTLGSVQYIGGKSWCMWGSKMIKAFQFILKTPVYWTSPNIFMISPTCIMISPNVLNIPSVLMVSSHMHHDILPVCWRSPDVFMLSPHMHHDIFPMYWTSPNVLIISPDVLMMSLRCTHGIPPMYWTHIIQGEKLVYG